MTHNDNVPAQGGGVFNPALRELMRAYSSNAAKLPHTILSTEIRWIEPTQPDDIHPDDWVDYLPARPKRLPTYRKLARMNEADRARVLIMQIASCAVEANGVRRALFEVGDEASSSYLVRNAGRRLNRAMDRALEFGLFTGGHWQVGALSRPV